MRENSYWFVSEETSTLVAICVDCQNDKKLKAWFWSGENGYASDVNCHLCNKSIYKKETPTN